MNSKTVLQILLPLTYILFAYVNPVHCTLSILQIVSPLPFEIVARRVIIHFSLAMLHIVKEISLKNASTFKYYLPFSLFFAFVPISFIRCVFQTKLTEAVSQPVLHLALVYTLVRPSVYSFSRNSIIGELTFVDNTIRPSKLSFAAK